MVTFHKEHAATITTTLSTTQATMLDVTSTNKKLVDQNAQSQNFAEGLVFAQKTDEHNRDMGTVDKIPLKYMGMMPVAFKDMM